MISNKNSLKKSMKSASYTFNDENAIDEVTVPDYKNLLLYVYNADINYK